MIDLRLGDCLELLPTLPDKSVDAIITDLPYGTTACKWDVIIPLDKMWEQVKRTLKERGAFVTTASQPFTSVLIMSNLKWFRYEWAWNKVNRISGHLNSKKRPMGICESVEVFSQNGHTYNPQMTQGRSYKARSHGRKSENYGKQKDDVITINNGNYYPRNYLEIPADERGTVGRVHPTQKPVALYEYLIRTYTNEGDTVLDFCMGSGTTGVACVKTNRNFIGIEKESNYFETAQRRIEHEQQQMIMEIL